MGKILNPEEIGMVLCLRCNGKGSFLKGAGQKEVCEKCGGFGYLKKEKPVEPHGQSPWRLS